MSASRPHATPQWLLLLFCLLLYLPGLGSLPVMDRDEARFAQASRQMLDSGDFLDIRFQDQPRYKKPVGIYWLQAAAVELTGATHDAIWAYRLPSLLGAVLAVLLTYRIGFLLFSPGPAWLGAAILASTLLLGVEARLATTDAVLLACTLAALQLVAMAYRQRRQPWRPAAGQWLGGWLALAAGIMIKGPAILVFVGLAVLATGAGTRSWRWLAPLRPGRGILLVLLLTLPWWVAITRHSEGQFLLDSLGGDILAKVLAGQESHGAPPGIHFLIFFAAFWPGTLLVSLAVPWIWRRRGHPGVRFCLAWILPAWLLFELIPTKLPHYLLPLYPALALLAARAWLSLTPIGSPRYRRWMRGSWLALGPIPAILPLAALLYLQPGALTSAGGLAAAGAAVAGVAATIVFGLRSRSRGALGGLLLANLLWTATNYQWLLPALDPLWISRSVQQALQPLRDADCPSIRLLSVGYREPSLVFLAGTDTRLLDDATAPDMERVRRHLQQDRCRAALLPGDAQPGNAAAVVRRIQGINYSKGRRLDLALWVNDALLPGAARRAGVE